MHAVVAQEAIDQPRQGSTLGNRFLGGMKVHLVHAGNRWKRKGRLA